MGKHFQLSYITSSSTFLWHHTHRLFSQVLGDPPLVNNGKINLIQCTAPMSGSPGGLRLYLYSLSQKSRRTHKILESINFQAGLQQFPIPLLFFSFHRTNKFLFWLVCYFLFLQTSLQEWPGCTEELCCLPSALGWAILGFPSALEADEFLQGLLLSRIWGV